MKAQKITEGVHWVGGIDWELRNFHGYLTQRGTSYNAYLIVDEKVTLIDTVKENCSLEFIKRISDVIDPSKIDYIISNHVEMDHAGAIPTIMKLAPKASIITSPNGEKGLKEHFTQVYPYKIVRTGDILNIGKRNIQFFLTPMVHWPDSMMSYCPEEKILFSNDAFGQHLASTERFDTEYPKDICLEEAKKYYANIVLPYGNQVKKALDGLQGIPLTMIAPSHGLIWKKHSKDIVSEYDRWTSNTLEKRAVIAYDTMWNSTKLIAYTIQEAFEEKGYKTEMFNLQKDHISDIMTFLLTSEYICVGSPTLNKNMMPTVASFLTYLQGLSPKNRQAISFGSYGWNGMSVKGIEEYFERAGLSLFHSFEVKYKPTVQKLGEIKELVMGKIGSVSS